MRTIHKYVLSPDKLNIEMPLGAIVISVDEQYGKICLWAEVDPDKTTTTRYFQVYGTGHTINAVNQSFIGTVKLNGGQLIFHVYELGVM